MLIYKPACARTACMDVHMWACAKALTPGGAFTCSTTSSPSLSPDDIAGDGGGVDGTGAAAFGLNVLSKSKDSTSLVSTAAMAAVMLAIAGSVAAEDGAGPMGSALLVADAWLEEEGEYEAAGAAAPWDLTVLMTS